MLLELFLRSNGVSTDTRSIEPGNIFFALKGPSFDGNAYAKMALDKGALHVISDDEGNSILPNCTIVKDALKALQQLGQDYRKHLGIPIIGLTGSNGKTTTKELLGAILKEKYKSYNTQGNLNNHIGVPLSLLSMPGDCEIAIIEMGANHMGEIEELAQIARPDFGVITNIGLAHLEGFGSEENIAKGKFELFKYCIDYNKPVCYIESAAYPVHEMLGEYPHRVKLTSEGCNINGQEVNIRAESLHPAIHFELAVNNEKTSITAHLSGDYNYDNIRLAIAVGIYFGCSAENIKNGIENYIPNNNRSQWVTWRDVQVFKDAYNANPSSMAKAIDNFYEQCKEEKMIFVLGGMKELGDFTSEAHNIIINQLKQFRGDYEVFLLGSEWDGLEVGKNYYKYSDKESLKSDLFSSLSKGSKVLIKGSRSNQLESIFDEL